MRTQRDVLTSAAGLTLAAALPAWAAGPPGELRIGYQKNGAILVAKQQGSIERRLTGLGVGLCIATGLTVSLRLWYLRRLFGRLPVLGHVARGLGPTVPAVLAPPVSWKLAVVEV